MLIETYISQLRKGVVISQMNHPNGSVTFESWWFWSIIGTRMNQLPVIAIFRITKIKC